MSIFTVMVTVALLATIASLMWGLVSMSRGGEYDEQHSAKLMSTRIGFQGLALILILVALLFK